MKDNDVLHCYNVVSDHIGVSKYHKNYPYIVISYEEEECDGSFVFEDNEITIYMKNMDSDEKLWKTMIHEYVHYMQSPSWFTRYYNMGYTYDNHPYEVEANLMENLWTKLKC